jgi:hypothetical protein
MNRRGSKNKVSDYKIYSAPHDSIYDAHSINRAVERAAKDHNFLDNAIKLLDGLKFPTFKNNIINHMKKVTMDPDTISLIESLDGYIEFHDQYHVRKSLEINDPEKQKENQPTDETLQSPLGRNRNISAKEDIKAKEADLVRHKRFKGGKEEEKKIREKSRADRQQTLAISASTSKKVRGVSSTKHQTKNEPTDRDKAAKFANLLEGLKFPVTKEEIRNHINQKKHTIVRQTLNMILRLIQDRLKKGIRYKNAYEIEKTIGLVIEKKSVVINPSQRGAPNSEKTGNENKKDLVKETLKPITKVKSEEDRELQEQEVESTGGGMGAGGG